MTVSLQTVSLHTDLAVIAADIKDLEERFPALNQRSPILDVANQVYERVNGANTLEEKVSLITKDTCKLLERERINLLEEQRAQGPSRQISGDVWSFTAVAIGLVLTGFFLGRISSVGEEIFKDLSLDLRK